MFALFVAGNVLEAGFAPTPQEVARRMMRAAGLRRGDVFYDLGSGDGVLLVIAAREFGARAVGVEIQGKLVEDSWRKAQDLGLRDEVDVIRGDFLCVDIGRADVLGLYLTPRVLDWLRPKLDKELRRGARTVSYRYPVEGWSPREVCGAFERREEPRIFLYEA
jgi:tRNA A58 N-methylase Trm61